MSQTPSDVVLAKVVHAVAEVLGVRKSDIGVETRAADVEAWDSFGHVRIVLALEQLFGLHLSMAEIERADSIAGLTSIVEAANGGSEPPSVAGEPDQ